MTIHDSHIHRTAPYGVCRNFPVPKAAEEPRLRRTARSRSPLGRPSATALLVSSSRRIGTPSAGCRRRLKGFLTHMRRRCAGIVGENPEGCETRASSGEGGKNTEGRREWTVEACHNGIAPKPIKNPKPVG